MEIESLPKGSLGKIGVLMGGPSSERQISLKSGLAVYESLKKMGLDVVPVDIQTDDAFTNTQLLKSLKLDCAFIALHGYFGEDGKIQKILDELNIAYTGSGAKASELAMDKVASREIFRQQRLCVPEYEVIEKNSYDNLQDHFLSKINFPLLVKPASHGSSVGLSLVEKNDGLAQALELSFKFDQRALIEEYVAGREVTVGILDEEALPVIEIIPKNKFFDFEAKYSRGITEYIVPAQLSDDLVKLAQGQALIAHKALGCFGCSRVDIIITRDNTAVVLEINTIPGFTETSLLPKAAKAKGLDFGQLCVQLITLAYEKTKARAAC